MLADVIGFMQVPSESGSMAFARAVLVICPFCSTLTFEECISVSIESCVYLLLQHGRTARDSFVSRVGIVLTVFACFAVSRFCVQGRDCSTFPRAIP